MDTLGKIKTLVMRIDEIRKIVGNTPDPDDNAETIARIISSQEEEIETLFNSDRNGGSKETKELLLDESNKVKLFYYDNTGFIPAGFERYDENSISFSIFVLGQKNFHEHVIAIATLDDIGINERGNIVVVDEDNVEHEFLVYIWKAHVC